MDKQNIEAILHAYRTKELGEAKKGEMTVWFAGRLVMGPVREDDEHYNEIDRRVPGWNEQYGRGQARTESVSIAEILLSDYQS